MNTFTSNNHNQNNSNEREELVRSFKQKLKDGGAVWFDNDKRSLYLDNGKIKEALSTYHYGLTSPKDDRVVSISEAQQIMERLADEILAEVNRKNELEDFLNS